MFKGLPNKTNEKYSSEYSNISEVLTNILMSWSKSSLRGNWWQTDDTRTGGFPHCWGADWIKMDTQSKYHNKMPGFVFFTQYFWCANDRYISPYFLVKVLNSGINNFPTTVTVLSRQIWHEIESKRVKFEIWGIWSVPIRPPTHLVKSHLQHQTGNRLAEKNFRWSIISDHSI